MSIFSRLGRGRAMRGRVRDVIGQAKEKADAELAPLRKLGLAVVRASTNCLSDVKPSISAPNEKERQLAEMSAFDEFLFFFLHHAMRTASGLMSQDEVNHLQTHLGPLISATAVETYCRHWPADIKRGLAAEFYQNLNAAEQEYASRGRVVSSGASGERSLQILEAVFACLGERVATVIGHDRDEGVALAVASVALKEFSLVRFEELILSYRKESTGLPDFDALS